MRGLHFSGVFLLFLSLGTLLQLVPEHIHRGVVMLVLATLRSDRFPNLSERHCTISRDSLFSHATVIQSELVEIHMHAFQKERGRREGGKERGWRRKRRMTNQRAGSFI